MVQCAVEQKENVGDDDDCLIGSWLRCSASFSPPVGQVNNCDVVSDFMIVSHYLNYELSGFYNLEVLRSLLMLSRTRNVDISISMLSCMPDPDLVPTPSQRKTNFSKFLRLFINAPN